jgi:serine/threonine protein kinase
MAVVYKGYQASLNRYVAIKVLRGNLARDEKLVARFRREALAVAKLSHPNILHVYDTGVAHGVYYIAMDYARGGTLKELLRRGPLPIDRAVSIATQLAGALDYAHRQGLVHRDVKPSNVLLTREGRPLLGDFGIARALHQTSQLTRTGARIGTPEYMAPEQAGGESPDGRADIYALGIVLYEMLAGATPFHAETPMATLYQHLNDAPPPLRKANSNIPTWLEAVVDKALAKRPEDRFRRARDFATDLRQRRISTPSTQRPSPPPPRITPTARKQPVEQKGQKSPILLLLGAIAVLTLVVLVAMVVLFLGGGDGQTGAGPQVVTRVVTQRVNTVVVTVAPNETSTPGPTIVPSRSPTPIPTIAPPRTPTPRVESEATWYISSLQADVAALRFFEGGTEQTPRDEREYSHRFARSETRYIYYELNIEYPEHKQPIDFEVEIVYYGPDGTAFSEFAANHRIEADWTSSWHSKGWGWDDPGQWPAGAYRAALYVEGELIAADTFEIYE